MNLLKKFLIKIILNSLRVLPPEASSKISLVSLKILNQLRIKLQNNQSISPKPSKILVCGMTFDNYLGLSAGIDKEGKYFNSLGDLGFSFVEVGTFTPLPQKGNEYPRIKRIVKEESLINRLGFNNPGILKGIQNVKKNKKNFTGVLGISIGKNKDTILDDAYKDYIFCLEHCFKFADYVAINISSPNTQNLRKLSSASYVDELTKEISMKTKYLEKKYIKKVPIFLKLSPDEITEDIERIISTSLSNDFSGFIISNTMNGKFRGISGGVSGKLLKSKSLGMLRIVHGLVGDKIPLIASGGISNKFDAEERLDNGAKLIQIYTSFVYKGPNVINDLLN